MISKIIITLLFSSFSINTYSNKSTHISKLDNTQNSLLWKISGNGLQHDSYLFGTMHNVDRTFLDSISGFRQAFKAAKQIAIEHDIFTMESDSSSWSQERLKDYYFMPKDTTYSMLYRSADFQFIDSTLRQYTPDYAKFKPEFWEGQLIHIAANESIDNVQSSLDRFILLIGYQNNKIIHFMETIESNIQTQIEYDSLRYTLDLQYQANELLNTLKQPNNIYSFLNSMTQIYFKQELNQLSPDSLVKHLGIDNGSKIDLDYFNQWHSIIVDTRNKKWIGKIISMIQEDSSLIAVGAGHLPGVNGLISLLRDRGYSVEPIK